MALTQEAVDRGVFGSPTFFVNDEMFFGKDQLRDVEEEILAQQRAMERLACREPPRVLNTRRQAAAQQASTRFVIEGRAPVQTVLENITANDLIRACLRGCTSLCQVSTAIPNIRCSVEADAAWSRPGPGCSRVRGPICATRSGPETGKWLPARTASGLARSCSPPASSMPWAIVVNRRLSARELEQIRIPQRRTACHLQFGPVKRPPIMRRAWARPLFDRAVRRLGVGPLNEEARAKPVETNAARQVAALMYTSGTTGAPKGVMLQPP